MKTTEVFVEQVLIGASFLLVVVLPFAHELDPVPTSLLEGIGLLGIAYLVGIPADRFADTLTSGWEKRSQALFVLKESPALSDEDPLPVQDLKIEAMKAEDGIAEWYGYLRARIRIARALAALAPALTISALLYVWPDGAPPWAQAVGLGGTVILYASAFRMVKGQEIPRTETVKETDKEQLAVARDPTIPHFLLLAALGITLAVVSRAPAGLSVAGGGLLLTLGAGWTTWRVTRTWLDFMCDLRLHSRAEEERKQVTDGVTDTQKATSSSRAKP